MFLQISGKMQAQLSASADQMKSMIEIIDDLIKNKRGAKKVRKRMNGLRDIYYFLRT